MPAKQRDTMRFFRGGRIAIPLAVIAIILFFALGGHRKIMNYAVDETSEFLMGGGEGEEKEQAKPADITQAREPGGERATMEKTAAELVAESQPKGVPPADEKVAAGIPAPLESAEPAGTPQAPPPAEEPADTSGAWPEPREALEVGRRTMAAYTASFLRDPFFSLIAEEEGRPAKLLDVGRAKMVGSVWGESGVIALLEDDQGRSYALRVGDPVVNGTVVSVTPASVTFSITMFGLTKQVTLELAEEGEW